jgi:hypothetical protein
MNRFSLNASDIWVDDKRQEIFEDGVSNSTIASLSGHGGPGEGSAIHWSLRLALTADVPFAGDDE